MKKRVFLAILMVIAIAITTACGGSGAAPAEDGTGADNGSNPAGNNASSSEVYEFDVGVWVPATNPMYVNGWEPWKNYVEKKTEGRVKMNLYPGATLGSSKSVLDDVKGGTYDIGALVPDYYPDTKLFQLSVLGLPFAFPDAQTGHDVMKKYIEANELDDAYEGLVYGGLFTTDPFAMFSADPVRSVADLKGKKVRLAGKSWQSVIEGWGAVPVDMKPEDAYLGLERGTIDVMIYTPTGAISQKYYEPAPYVTNVGALVTSVSPVMNPDKFNSLPEDLQQQFMEDFFPTLVNNMVESYMNGSKTAYEELAKVVEGKGEVIELSPEAAAEFRKTAAVSWEQWIEDANSRGYDGKKLMSDFVKFLKEEGVTPPIDM